VIVAAQAVRVVIALRPVDFRKGHDGLAALVEQELGLDPHSGVVVVFRSRRGDRLKLLLWDGSGLVLTYKRLEQGSFAWPSVRNGVMRLSPAQFEALFEGLDWRRVRAPRVRRPAAAE
jgi:transposase